MKKYERFEDWLDERENFASRFERLLDEYDGHMSVARLQEWLRAAWDCAREEVETEEQIAYSEEYDAYYYTQKNEWIDSRCNDRDCHFCNNRPDKPL